LKAYQPNSDGSTRRYHLQVFHSIGRGAAFAAICCIVLANHSQTLQVTANWGSPTGITTTDTSYGINADRTDPRIVGYPGNAAYNSQLSRLGVQYLRIWGGGQGADSNRPGGWRFHEKLADEGWDVKNIKDTLRNYAPYGPKHIMLEIGGWPAWMNEPGSNPEKPRLDPSHYGDFAKYCADLVRIVNKDNPGGTRMACLNCQTRGRMAINVQAMV
jgi:xylan 1,4-beta-xylosidase